MKKIKSLYKFIYAFVYKVYIIKNTETDARDYAIMFTLIYAEIHLGMIYTFLDLFLGIGPMKSCGLSYGERKYIGMPILFIISIPFYLYLKKRHQRIVKDYKDKKLFTLMNIVIMIALFVLPLVISVYLQKYTRGI